jgi:hypothetical protein
LDFPFSSSTVVVVWPTVFFASKLRFTTGVTFFGKSNVTYFPLAMNACEISFASTLLAGSEETLLLPPLL